MDNIPGQDSIETQGGENPFPQGNTENNQSLYDEQVERVVQLDDEGNTKLKKTGEIIEVIEENGERKTQTRDLNEPVTEDIVHRRISDDKYAEDLAYTERDEGRDAALKKEGLMMQDLESGMSEQERENEQAIEKLKEKCPNLFELADKRTNEDGITEYVLGLRALKQKASLDFRSNEEVKGQLKSTEDIIQKNSRFIGVYALAYRSMIQTNGGEAILSRRGLSLPPVDGRVYKRGSIYQIMNNQFERDCFVGVLKALEALSEQVIEYNASNPEVSVVDLIDDSF
jgi:hypothetical protein